MKLYIAKCNFDYEGFDVIGVFDSELEALKACDSHKYTNGEFRGDSRTVEEVELNKVVEVTI